MLEHEISQLKRLIFGAKSERFISNEPPLPPNTLFSQAHQDEQPLENLTQEITYTRDKPIHKRGGRKELPAHLERNVIELKPQGYTDDMKYIGMNVTEELEYKPGQMYVNRYERPKYIDPITKQILIAPMPSRVVDKCIAGPGMMAHVIISKYLDHLPYYRQLQQFKRMHQVDISKSTFGEWASQYVTVLEPIYNAHKKEILSNGYLQTDESYIEVQSDEVEGKCHKGYMWVSRDPQNNLVLFTYQEGRSGESLINHIHGFKGKLQADGYGAYEKYKDNPDFILFSCWAHARRYFEQALDNDKERSEFIITQIQILYEIEKSAKEHNLTNEDRQKWRHKYAAPVLNTIKEYLDKNAELILPASAIGKAFGYTIKRWDKLVAYTIHGEVEIDNNLVENSIRPLELGRKNYLFAGSHESAQRSAVVYSLLGTCKLHSINPYVWLTDVYQRIKDHPINRIAELLPQNWKNSNDTSSV
ncbi:MAG: IS66 family transposase [Saprospiraceae bacterium]|nr:IS66 family transposase [Saprospiraceae bacterium]